MYKHGWHRADEPLPKQKHNELKQVLVAIGSVNGNGIEVRQRIVYGTNEKGENWFNIDRNENEFVVAWHELPEFEFSIDVNIKKVED